MYLQKYSEPEPETLIHFTLVHPLYNLKILDIEKFPKKIWSENAKMICFKEPNPMIIFLDTKCYEPNSKNRIKI